MSRLPASSSSVALFFVRWHVGTLTPLHWGLWSLASLSCRIALACGSLCRPVVDRVFPLEEVQAAHEYMESNQNIGKILLKLL